jgi:hypothetical protein
MSPITAVEENGPLTDLLALRGFDCLCQERLGGFLLFCQDLVSHLHVTSGKTSRASEG